jgi:hypothetical protein
MLARPEQYLRPLPNARQDTARQGRQQSGPHDRGLAASRWSDNPEHRRTDGPRDELGNEPLASEEVPTSNEARPLKGHTTVASRAAIKSARSRAA